MPSRTATPQAKAEPPPITATNCYETLQEAEQVDQEAPESRMSVSDESHTTRNNTKARCVRQTQAQISQRDWCKAG